MAKIDIFHPKTQTVSQSSTEKTEPKRTYYSELGKFTEKPKNNRCWAMTELFPSGERYYIYGSKIGKFFNPWYDIHVMGYDWIPVNKAAFDYYLMYLSSNKSLYLVNAEKEYQFN